MRRILAAIALAALFGCGYEGHPLPPLANVPSQVTGLSAIERGLNLVIRFTPPQLTTEGFPFKVPPDLDVRAGIASQPFDEQAWAASARKLSAGKETGGVAEYEMPIAQWVGKELTVGVRALGSKGKNSEWSFETVPIVASPQPPADLRAENTAMGVRLSWSGAASEFQILRKTSKEDFMPVAEVPKSPWTDTSTQFDQTYEYKVQAIEKLADNREAESEISPEVSITPVDIFPPATPSGLQVTAAPASAELSWNSNNEPDLASYRVYRSVDGGPFERVAEVQVPAYSDHDVTLGKQYRYEVTAVDRLGNESSRSAPVGVRLQ